MFTNKQLIYATYLLYTHTYMIKRYIIYYIHTYTASVCITYCIGNDKEQISRSRTWINGLTVEYFCFGIFSFFFSIFIFVGTQITLSLSLSVFFSIYISSFDSFSCKSPNNAPGCPV